MTDPPLAFAPSDAYTWQESVLSTRSLSYISTVSVFGTPGLPSPLTSSRLAGFAQPSYSQPQSGMEQHSEEDLELAVRGVSSRPVRDLLPPSVAYSLLFALPQEIRDRIYAFCLATSPIPVIEWPSSHLGGSGLAPQLLRTCKAIFIEATPLLYAGNAFSFAHPSDANVFVRAIASPLHSGLIGHVNLHLRAQDLRLWMPYLTSSSEFRSLKYDFPNLKELIVRYKSTKWQHAHPIDANMRNWCEDRGLDEVVDGLRNAFYHKSGAKDEQGRDIYDEYIDADDQVMSSPRRSSVDEQITRSRAPTVKVICMCRVSLNQFLALTTDVQHNPAQPPGTAGTPALAPAPAAFHTAVFIPQVIQQVIGISTTTQGLAEEGEEFRGFTASDLRGRAKRVWEMNGTNTTPALVARTVFADRKQILLALELFAYEPSNA